MMFILLNIEDGAQVAFNIAHIVSYGEGWIAMAHAPEDTQVRQSFYQIKAQIDDVTARTTRDLALAAIDAAQDRLEAVPR